LHCAAEPGLVSPGLSHHHRRALKRAPLSADGSLAAMDSRLRSVDLSHLSADNGRMARTTAECPWTTDQRLSTTGECPSTPHEVSGHHPGVRGPTCIVSGLWITQNFRLHLGGGVDPCRLCPSLTAPYRPLPSLIRVDPPLSAYTRGRPSAADTIRVRPPSSA
jgi:hypothetical protein